MSTPGAVAAAVLVAVVGVLMTSFVSVVALAVGVPSGSVLVLAVATSALVALLGTLFVARRVLQGGGAQPALALLGPLVLAGLLIVPGAASLGVRIGVCAAVLGAALLGLRAATTASPRPLH